MKSHARISSTLTQLFHMPPEMRSLKEIKADLVPLQKEGKGLLEVIIGGDVRK